MVLFYFLVFLLRVLLRLHCRQQSPGRFLFIGLLRRKLACSVLLTSLFARISFRSSVQHSSQYYLEV